MKKVIVESPFSGDGDHLSQLRNVLYTRCCMKDCMTRQEAPYASHLLYTQPWVLDDNEPGERELGILAGFEWRNVADYTVFYIDLGWSKGMEYGLQHCKEARTHSEQRSLPPHRFEEFEERYKQMKAFFHLTPPGDGSVEYLKELSKYLF